MNVKKILVAVALMVVSAAALAQGMNHSMEAAVGYTSMGNMNGLSLRSQYGVVLCGPLGVVASLEMSSGSKSVDGYNDKISVTSFMIGARFKVLSKGALSSSVDMTGGVAMNWVYSADVAVAANGWPGYSWTLDPAAACRVNLMYGVGATTAIGFYAEGRYGFSATGVSFGAGAVVSVYLN